MFTLKTALTHLQNAQTEDDETLSVQCVISLQVKVNAFIAHPATDKYQLVLSSVGTEQEGLSAWQDTIVTPSEILALLKLSPLRPIWRLGTVDVVRLDEPYEQAHTPVQQGDVSMNLLRFLTDQADTEKSEALPHS